VDGRTDAVSDLIRQDYLRNDNINGRRLLRITYLLTPWCRVLHEQLTGLQLLKKFPAFHGTRRFITALTSVRLLRDASPGNTSSRRYEWGSSLPPDCFVSRASIPHVSVS